MYELVYCSLAKRSLNKNDIPDILNTAKAFNSKNGITGCLLYYKNEFIQILEGEKNVVRELYKNIQHDNRHSAVTLMIDDELEERKFKEWSMAYFELNNHNMNELGNSVFVENFMALSNLAQQPTLTVKLFWKMAKLLIEK
jgi:Sensors of blue-light using FAD